MGRARPAESRQLDTARHNDDDPSVVGDSDRDSQPLREDELEAAGDRPSESELVGDDELLLDSARESRPLGEDEVSVGARDSQPLGDDEVSVGARDSQPLTEDELRVGDEPARDVVPTRLPEVQLSERTTDEAIDSGLFFDRVSETDLLDRVSETDMATPAVLVAERVSESDLGSADALLFDRVSESELELERDSHGEIVIQPTAPAPGEASEPERGASEQPAGAAPSQRLRKRKHQKAKAARSRGKADIARELSDSTVPASVGERVVGRGKSRSLLGASIVALAVGAIALARYHSSGDVPAEPAPPVVAPPGAADPVLAPASASTVSVGQDQPAGSSPGQPLPSASPVPPAPSTSLPSAEQARALPEDEGFLLVRSSLAADVYVTGIKIGASNRAASLKCGFKWVRLGEGEPPRWVTPGATVEVKCRDVSTVELEPER